jgi:4-hydroxyphenylpyruvate dioxygenase-like putative hemolysin
MNEFERQVAEALKLILSPAENVSAREAGAVADWYSVHGGDIQQIARRVQAAIEALAHEYAETVDGEWGVGQGPGSADYDSALQKAHSIALVALRGETKP